MADSDLVFGLPYDPTLPARLVFGADGDAPPMPDGRLAIRGRLPGLRGRARVAIARGVSVRGRLPGLRGALAVRYASDTQRPLVNDTTSAFQDAQPVRDGLRTRFDEADVLRVIARARYQQAKPLAAAHRARWSDTVRLRTAIKSRFQEAQRLATPPARFVFQQAVRRAAFLTAAEQHATKLATAPLRTRFQETLRDRRNLAAVRFQEALAQSRVWSMHEGPAVALYRGWRGRYQEAMRPPIGIWTRPQPPLPEPCYVPTLPAHLVFSDLWTGSPNLLFVCDRHEPDPEPGETIVVPVKEVYLTINSAYLLRLDNGYFIPTLGMNMSLDVDSWTWSFSASIPASAEAALKRNSNGGPVVVQATINDVPYRFVIERMGRERTFNSAQLRVQGRGLPAELDAPNAPVMSFGNSQARTARQLLDDILTFNGVPIGWTIGAFDPLDWSVPAGAFSHVGTYISALNAVAGAVGAYIQPHNTDRELDVRMRYPVPSWQWGGVTPQFELPAAVTTSEGFDWEDKAVYNRVFVSGQQGGVLGQYTRAGTAGDLVASAVVDPLITHADAARQRGRTILSDTGSVATISLRLPVLAETGIIKPGNFVHYTESGKRHIGLTRGVNVDVSLPTIYQTLTVESHLEPV